jgi:hypothetical protein
VGREGALPSILRTVRELLLGACGVAIFRAPYVDEEAAMTATGGDSEHDVK